MIIFKKDGSKLELLAFPNEYINKGEYVIIEDHEKDLSLILQVIDIDYIDPPGMLDEIIREGLLKSSKNYISEDIYEVGRSSRFLRDTKVVKAVIRGALVSGKFTTTIPDLPSRVSSSTKKVSITEVLKLIKDSIMYPIRIGRDYKGEEVILDAKDLDGKLTLITGMKGFGKSHLAKLLVLNLVRYGAPVIVLDLNGEYIGLSKYENIEVLKPGVNLYFNLKYLGKETMLRILTNILDLPGVSASIFDELWSIMERTNREITIQSLMTVINNFVKNLMIRDALLSRLMILSSTRFITSEDKSVRLEEVFNRNKGIIIVLRGLSSIERKILVEIILSKLSELLERELIKPLFLVAEEAHLYVRETYWEDVITRMRHYGLFIILITNQPDSLDHQVYRQLDNIFIFRFQNDHDLDHLSKVSNIDSDTIKSIARDLPRGRVLVIGGIVENMPIVVDVAELPVPSYGETKYVFEFNKNPIKD